MKWKKLGRIINETSLNWTPIGMMLPLAHLIDNDTIRIYFGGRSSDLYSRIGFIDVASDNLFDIIQKSEQPIVNIGDLGTFDDCGLTPCCVIKDANNFHMYYTGVTLLKRTTFTNSIGILTSLDNGTNLHRYSKGPIFSRNIFDPYQVGHPWVVRGKDKWRMWYFSGTSWEHVEELDNPKHFYTIKHAYSKDGLNWIPDDNICINYNGDEFSICRPCVIFENGTYKMWYTYRGDSRSYRIGYAESSDGLQWTRLDNRVGIDVSDEGWDSEMLCYPYVFDLKGKRYLLYNGNGYGRTGFGLAVQKEG